MARAQPDTDPDVVAEASKESFPASDPPAYAPAQAGATDRAMATLVRSGHLIRLEAKEGRELELENFLLGGQPLADGDGGTVSWFAIRLNDRCYAVFETFSDEQTRAAHLGGDSLELTINRAADLLAKPPMIDRFDVLAAKSLLAPAPGG